MKTPRTGHAVREAVIAAAVTASAVLAFAVLALLSRGAQADTLPDPTRPPASALAAPADAASAPGDALQLQSVLIGRGRTPAAVISGELVLLGGRVRDARLVRVTERSAVLKGPQGETTLALLPRIASPSTSIPTPQHPLALAEPTR